MGELSLRLSGFWMKCCREIYDSKSGVCVVDDSSMIFVAERYMILKGNCIADVLTNMSNVIR